MLQWCVVVVTLVATVANIKKKWWGFALYMLTNAYWAVYNIVIAETRQAVLYLVFFVLAAWGVWSWVRDVRNLRHATRR